MKKIKITSSGYCEIVQEYAVSDEVYERFVSNISSLSELEFEENQYHLIQLCSELEENAEQVEDIMFRQLDTPEVINEINYH
jgi:hypothetical protein